MKKEKQQERGGEIEIAVEILGWRWYNPPGYCSVLLPPDNVTVKTGKFLDLKPEREPKYRLGTETVPQFYSDEAASMQLQEIVRQRGKAREYVNELAFLKTNSHPADLDLDKVIDLLMSATPKERSLCAHMALTAPERDAETVQDKR